MLLFVSLLRIKDKMLVNKRYENSELEPGLQATSRKEVMFCTRIEI